MGWKVGVAFVVGLALFANVRDARAELINATTERFEPVTFEDAREREKEFVKRNPGWTTFDTSREFTANIRSAWRASRRAGPSLSDEQARARGVAFMQKNADLLGTSLAELARLNVTVHKKLGPPTPGEVPVAYAIVFEGKGLLQRGFERFLKRHVHIVLELFDDGDVGRLTTQITPVPRFRMRATPKFPESQVRSVVEGYPLYRYQEVGIDPKTGLRTYRQILTGTIAPTEIESVELVLRVSDSPPTLYTLLYEVVVQHGDREIDFYIDPDDGMVLGGPNRKPIGIIVP